jgi:hypothetical protein
MRYLCADNDNKAGFKDPSINTILDTDVPISDEFYNRYLTEESQGKEFRIANIHGTTFEEIFIQVPLTYLPPQVDMTDYLLDLDFRISKIELGV